MYKDNTTARWRRIRTLFQQTLAQPVEAQAQFLKEAAAGDADIYDDVRRLLDAAESTGMDLSEAVAEAAAEMSPAILNDTIQQYRIIDLLGEGGMGQVYLAERDDQHYQQRVAIKVLGIQRPTDELVARFRAERQMLATLSHVNIAKLLDGGETDDGAPYFVMEHIDGQSIDSYCDENGLNTKARLQLFTKVCAAVDHAHRNLIIHRDIKPSNIMVDASGEPKLLDFGIAKLLETDIDGLETRSSARMMSPLHASPEQVRGQPISVASDIYALGVLLYQMLTGQHPYSQTATTPAEIERAICETEPSKPSARMTTGSTNADDLARIARARSATVSELAQTIGGDLDNIVLMAMQKEPERRYASVRELVADIDRFLNRRPVTARPTGIAYRIRLFVRRNLLPTVIAATASAAVVASTTMSVYRIAEERDVARAERVKAEAIGDFLLNVFGGAHADVAQGEETTARELLNNGANSVTQTLEEDPALRAVMLRVLGEAFYSLGNADRAEALYLEATKALDEQAAPALDEIATLQLVRGMVDQDRAKFDAAEEKFSRARQLRAQHFGERSFEVAEAIQMQAHLTAYQGDMPAAIALYEEGLAISRDLPGDNTGVIAEFLSKLAAAHRELGDDKTAERLLLDAIAALDRAYGNRHPRYLESQRYLADVYRDQQRFSESEALYLSNIAVRQEVLGPNHTEVGTAYNEYSILLSDMGDTDGAVAAAAEFLRVLELNYDEPTAGLGAAYNNMAWLKIEQSDYAGAIVGFNQSIGVQDAIGLDADHLHRSFPVYGRAVARRKNGALELAMQEFERVLEMRRQHFEESNLLISEVKVELGATLISVGRPQDAETVLIDALDHLRKEQGATHKTTTLAESRLSEAMAMNE
ncbi:MAG: tetratricopeptide repeat protein [Pseudomonadota bacterium]